jgi:hypothetical protein
MAYVYNGAGAPNGARELDTSSLISHHLCSRNLLPRCSCFVPSFSLASFVLSGKFLGMENSTGTFSLAGCLRCSLDERYQYTHLHLFKAR